MDLVLKSIDVIEKKCKHVSLNKNIIIEPSMTNSKIRRPHPVDEEIKFKFEELFFSTTDAIGNILTGNDVFVKISQYSRDELIGSPHNIIRHPDMPKIVFKVLWDYIQAGKPVAAYVKNLAKDGRYYWVLAAVFPIPEGYLSIRLKPSTAFFGLMPDVYAALMKAEQEGGTDASLKLLLEVLQSKGFKSYDAFFLAALIEELKAVDVALKSSEETSWVLTHHGKALKENEELFNMLRGVQGKCQGLRSLFHGLFSNVHLFLELRDKLGENSTFIIDLSQQIFHLAMNANVESFRAGTLGASLAVLAKEIQLRSDDMKRNADAILKQANVLSEDSDKKILEVGLQITAPKLQNEMVNSFIQEILAQDQSQPISEAKIHEMSANGICLINLLETYSKKSIELLSLLKKDLSEMVQFVESISTTVRELEMTQISGSIESARIGELGKTFLVVFEEMDKLNKEARVRLEEFREILLNILEHINDMLFSEKEIESLLGSIKTPIQNMEQFVSR